LIRFNRIHHYNGVWVSDKELTLNEDGKCYNDSSTSAFIQTKRIPYVGFAPKTNVIPRGILLRISLARWWKPEDSEISERCYLQLSGWYGFSDLIAL
jgi:hypothetical protein